MKKTKRMSAALISVIMLGTFSVVPNNVYAETDVSRPFTAIPEDDFITNKITALFKNEYSEAEIENTIIPELKKINGVRGFIHGFTKENGRAMYTIELDYSDDEKEAAYNTAKKLYDTGYFYCVEMYVMPPLVTSENEQTPTDAKNSNGTRVNLEDFLEEIKDYSKESSAKYGKMTVDEVYKDILGNYVLLSSESDNWRTHLLAMDENAEFHGMIQIKTEVCVKMKHGTELTDIPASVKHWLDEDVYILKSDDMKALNEYVNSIKNNENVLAIDNHYGIYEDTANYFNIEGLRYDGAELTEEFIAEFPHLGLKLNDIDAEYGKHYMNCRKDRNADPIDIFNEMKKLSETVSGLDAVFIQSAVWLDDPDMYYCSYCNSPTLIEGLDGDANIDGDMDISDAVIVMQSLANPDKYGVNKEKGITYQGIKNADTNKDGITNIDALNIQRKLLKLD